jgi:hypothetical protein
VLPYRSGSHVFEQRVVGPCRKATKKRKALAVKRAWSAEAEADRSEAH